jgi:hypothetical protein
MVLSDTATRFLPSQSPLYDARAAAIRSDMMLIAQARYMRAQKMRYAERGVHKDMHARHMRAESFDFITPFSLSFARFC